ncbi:hypothetical protein [Streptomyces albidoflavus]|uniref:hypothetical protein n=1 Tax=Streptomyces albidoflavus TaxID=1886 RepID=UPI00188CD6A8|nr:hypothetical protein [Streptomyces albidoflavus]MBF4138136.1 hypothetical protein [Streptomyces albidoflavus]
MMKPAEIGKRLDSGGGTDKASRHDIASCAHPLEDFMTAHHADPAVAGRHLANLTAFVLRARRVEAHSLAADRTALMALASGNMTVSPQPDGSAVITQVLPPEEQVESAAARVRPLLLEQEPCNYGKAIAALKHYHPEDKATYRTLSEEWRRRTRQGSSQNGSYQVMTKNLVTEAEHQLHDVDLAFAWIYGDVVHHDPDRRKAADPFGLAERYKAAAPLVAGLMVRTIALLNRVLELNEAGRIPVEPEVFDERVALEDTTFRYQGQLYEAAVGTPAPTSVTEPWGETWAPFSPPRA